MALAISEGERPNFFLAAASSFGDMQINSETALEATGVTFVSPVLSASLPFTRFCRRRRWGH